MTIITKIGIVGTILLTIAIMIEIATDPTAITFHW